MKKKNRPSVPRGATLVLVHDDADSSDPILCHPWDGVLLIPGVEEPLPEIDWYGVKGWVVVDADGTVTIGPQ